MLYCFFFQWLFFQTQLIDSMVQGVDLVNLDFYSRSKPTITLLGLIAVFAFFLGMYTVVKTIPAMSFNHFKFFLERVNLERLLLLYAVIYLLLFFQGSIIWAFPSLTQPFFVLFEFRWSLFFLLFSATIFQKRLVWIVFVIIIFETIASFYSFFSHFKEVFIFSFLSYWIFFFRSSLITRVWTVPIILLLIYSGAVWSSIKTDYRDFLNKGTGSQAVLVTRREAYDKLLTLVSSMDSRKTESGFDDLVDRISWIGAFDAVYNHVPKVRPHEDGSLWLEGIRRMFMPRFLFPDKKVLTDSKELNYYSGLGVSEKDTSISLSMIAASYIDFGEWGMFVPIFLFGLFCGWVFKRAVLWGKYVVVGYALTMPMIHLLQINEQS